MQLYTHFFEFDKNSCVPWCQLEALYHPATGFAGQAVIATGLGLVLRNNWITGNGHVKAISQILHGQYHIWDLFGICMF